MLVVLGRLFLVGCLVGSFMRSHWGAATLRARAERRATSEVAGVLLAFMLTQLTEVHVRSNAMYHHVVEVWGRRGRRNDSVMLILMSLDHLTL